MNGMNSSDMADLVTSSIDNVGNEYFITFTI